MGTWSWPTRCCPRWASDLAEAALAAPDLRTGARLVTWFAAAHLVIFVIAPLLSQPNPPLDVIEMHWWGQQWAMGYHKHPPTPAWLAAGAVDLGLGLFGIYLVSQLCIMVCFASAWVLARRWLPVRTAVCAAVMLESIYYYGYPTPELNHNVVLMATWAWTVAACWLAVERGRMRDWLVFGLAMGLGLLTKYTQGVIIVLLLGWLVLDPEVRSCWRKPGPWLACLVGLVVFWPHLQWAAQHDWITLRYVQERSADSAAGERLSYPIDFTIDQLLPLLPVMITVFLLRWGEGRAERQIPPRAGRFLTVVAVGPFIVLFLISLLGGMKLRNMWGAPLWTFAPLGLFVAATPRIDPAALKRVIITAGCFLALASVGLIVRNLAGPYLTGDGERVQFDGPLLARESAEAWAKVSDEPLPIVGGPDWLAGNVCFWLPHHPLVYGNCDPRETDRVNDEVVRQRGAVLIWYRETTAGRFNDMQPPGEAEAWLARFPNAVVQPDIVMPFRTRAEVPPVRLGLAVVPPSLIQR